METGQKYILLATSFVLGLFWFSISLRLMSMGADVWGYSALTLGLLCVFGFIAVMVDYD